MNKFFGSKEARRTINNGHYEDTGAGELYLPRQKLLIGGRFGNEHWRAGECIGPYEESPNLIVDQGLTYILNVVFEGATNSTNWYVGIYQDNYTPVAGVTDQTLNSAATRIDTTFSEATLPPWVDVVTGTQITNTASKAQFTFTASQTVWGAFLEDDNVETAADAKTGHTLMAASLFGSSRAMENTDELLITYTIDATGA